MTTTPSLVEETGSVAEYLAEEMRAITARRRVRQREIADILGIGQAQVSARMNGHVPFTIEEIVVLAWHFDMPPGELLQTAADRMLPMIEAANENGPRRTAPGGGSMFVLPDVDRALRARRDSNPKPSDTESPAPLVPTTPLRVVSRIFGGDAPRPKPEQPTISLRIMAAAPLGHVVDLDAYRARRTAAVDHTERSA